MRRPPETRTITGRTRRSPRTCSSASTTIGTIALPPLLLQSAVATEDGLLVAIWMLGHVTITTVPVPITIMIAAPGLLKQHALLTIPPDQMRQMLQHRHCHCHRHRRHCHLLLPMVVEMHQGPCRDHWRLARYMSLRAAVLVGPRLNAKMHKEDQRRWKRKGVSLDPPDRHQLLLGWLSRRLG